MFALSMLVDAAILGLIIALRERGDRPGWPALIACTLAIGFATGILATLLPDALALLAWVGGAAVGAGLLTGFAGMAPRRSLSACAIYLVVGFALSLVWAAIS